MTDAESDFRGVSLKKELVDTVENYINDHPEEGYRSIAEFVSEAIRTRIRELKNLPH